MTEYLSKKIKVLSVVAMIGVLIIHSYYTESVKWEFVHSIQFCLTRMSCFVNPLFFLLSGYLFFQKLNSFGIIKHKIYRRHKTLFIPYLIWCLMFIITVSLISLVHKTTTNYFALLRENHYIEFVRYVFWDPAAFHLWFLRDLIIIVLLTPISYLGLKYIPRVFLFINYILCSFEFVPIISLGWFFFNFGAYYSFFNRVPFDNIKTKYGPIILLISLLAVYLLYKFTSLSMEIYVSIPLNIIYLIGIWKSYDYYSHLIPIKRIIFIADYTFIIYCSHIPLLIITKQIIYPALLDSSIGCMVGYIIAPILTLALIINAAKFTKKNTPKFYHLISGQR